jgi:uncharacterized membrane protein
VQTDLASLPRGELIAAGLSLALLVTYHAFLWFMNQRDPAFTVQRVNARVRLQWVEGVMSQGKDILAVQTLRNSTMAATFLASTSVVLVMGSLTLLAGDLANARNPKQMILLLDLFVAFYGFAMSIRRYNHVGYMLGMPDAVERGLSPAHVAKHLDRAADHYSVGMRALHLLIPIVFWFFGPWPLLGATCALVVLLYMNDRAPTE